MAMKGFLASGFQKLIGASRIKGANDQWVGEQNQVPATGGFPLAATLVPGFNYVELSATSTPLYSSGALFATNPTSYTQVILRNSANNNSNWSFLNVATSGGLSLANSNSCVLETGDTLTLVYDVSANLWREVARSRPAFYTVAQTISANGKITLSAGSSEYLYFLDIGGLSEYTITGLDPAHPNGTPSGTRVTIVGNSTMPSSSVLRLQAYSGASPFVDETLFYINGDFIVSRGSSITLQKIAGGWIEIARTNLSY